MIRSCEHGRSMIEMLGVLAIVGILSIGAISGYTKAMQKIKNDRMVTQLSMLVMNIRSGFIGQMDYSSLSSRVLLDAGMVPSDMVVGAEFSSQTGLKHAMNGNVYVYKSLNATGMVKAFEVYLTGLTRQTCVALATTDWGMDPASGFVSMYIGTDEVVDGALMEDINTPGESVPNSGVYTTGQHENAIPLTYNMAMAACTCSGTDCTVGFKYY